MPKVGSKAFGDRARRRLEKLAGKPGGPAKKREDAKAIEERQRQEREVGIKRGTKKYK